MLPRLTGYEVRTVQTQAPVQRDEQFHFIFAVEAGQERVVAERSKGLTAVIVVVFDDLRAALGDVARLLALFLPVPLLCGQSNGVRMQGCSADFRQV